jgi:Holliday junction resolvase RusA-like endonuclease
VWGKLPGFNEMIAASKVLVKPTGFSKYNYLKKTWNKRILLAIKKAGIKPVEKCYLSLTWVQKNKRRDPDNLAAFIKFLLDGMQHAGIIKNDGWNQIEGWENGFVIGKKEGVSVEIQGQGKNE